MYAEKDPPVPYFHPPDTPYAPASANRAPASADYRKYTIPASASCAPDS